ncbi:uncharacterized protein EDC14_102016 [Hydrogenispora ethanolica]|jgi:uncharacterized protein|uniref:Radical SAM core domain-containing protein n=1 Tax=Hydrogenispora ethanolica TaxID=1082276 RepID=A0A4R1RDV1_HYDET|nr:thioether cross-link-forming SCIFF peptide maturase [Hydrogenispora ethanolica]TCL63732.1 uncharacterized protein EDC14_102016 [Hydrogenispora ethanolica]
MANWHAFKALGRYFLFDVRSNSLFTITETVHNYLHDLPVPEAERPQIAADLAELKAAGYLSDLPDEVPVLKRDSSIKALCLHVSHDCNLRCKYCFAGTGPFGGNREQMSFEVGRQAIDLLLRESGNRRQLEVDFFGGEPLLNLEVVRQIMDYARDAQTKKEKDIHFTLTTNGIALTQPVRDFLNQYQLALVLSIDGRREVNDRMRGAGVYDRIVPQYLDLIRSRGNQNYYVRGTYTANNLDFSEDVRHLYELGFRELSLEPVVETGGPYRLSEEHLEQIEAEYEKLAQFYLEKKQAGAGFTFFHFEVSLEHGPCLPKRLTGCGAGFDYFAVTPAGELYPCHQFVGRKDYQMGDVIQGVIRTDLREKFGAATLYTKRGCSECWSRFYCSGGCHANAQLLNGSIDKPDEMSCKMQRKRLECALALKGIELEAQAAVAG